MKKIYFIVFAFHFFLNGDAQQDTALMNRLHAMLQYNQAIELEKVMDYTYPKLFTIVPREQMLEVLKSTFDSEEFSTTLDSIKVDKIYPVFAIKDESFAKINHSMLMRMKFKEPIDSAEDVSDREFMASMMEQQFGAGNARYDKASDALVIRLNPVIIAIKYNKDAKWYFVNFNEDNPVLLNMLFSKEVLDKLKEYK